jgi:hypothetical protein
MSGPALHQPLACKQPDQNGTDSAPPMLSTNVNTPLITPPFTRLLDCKLGHIPLYQAASTKRMFRSMPGDGAGEEPDLALPYSHRYQETLPPHKARSNDVDSRLCSRDQQTHNCGRAINPATVNARK